MERRNNIFIGIVAGILLAYILLAATLYRSSSQARLCDALIVEVQDSLVHPFVTSAEILSLLQSHGMDLQGKTKSEVLLDSIEKIAGEHDMVQEAQCCLLPSGQVRLTIRQRIPVLRLLPVNEGTFFLDEEGEPMRIDFRRIGIHPMNLPVVTGHIAMTDTLKLHGLFEMALFVQSSEYWTHLVQDIEVEADGRWTIHPAEGNFDICLGYPTDLPSKLGTVRSFYRDIYPKTGPDHYSRLNLEFKDQLICTRRK